MHLYYNIAVYHRFDDEEAEWELMLEKYAYDFLKEWYDNISIDPGLNNPLSAHWYAVDYDNNIYVIGIACCSIKSL